MAFSSFSARLTALFCVLIIMTHSSCHAFRSQVPRSSSMLKTSKLYLSNPTDVSVTSSSSASEAFARDELVAESTDSIDLEKLAAESAAAAVMGKVPLPDVPIERKAPRQAKWFPMLLSPPFLDGSYAGDVGFDPLNFAKDKDTMVSMREAEIKHARLAMLGAAGWPLEELWHKNIAELLGLDSILTKTDQAPSILNGGLDNGWIIGTGVVSLLIGGALELQTATASKEPSYKPGNLGFDPLNLYSLRSSFGLDNIFENITREEKIARGKFDMELCEIKNGRLAMLAVVGYVAQEFVTGIPVVQQTPLFFGDPIV